MHRSSTTIALLALLGWMCLPARAGANGQLYLTWDDCALDGAGSADQPIGCLFNEGSLRLFCAFVLDAPVTDVLGIEVAVDVQHSAPTLPDWWRMQGTGACRDGALHVSGDFRADPTCVDPWNDLGGGEVVYRADQPAQGQARMLGTYAIRSDSARTLEPGAMYYGLAFVISNERSVFPGECAGCLEPACLVLNTIRLLRGPAADPPVVTLDVPGSGHANQATWKGGSGADCAAVPVRNATWGSLKALYR